MFFDTLIYVYWKNGNVSKEQRSILSNEALMKRILRWEEILTDNSIL